MFPRPDRSRRLPLSSKWIESGAQAMRSLHLGMMFAWAILVHPVLAVRGQDVDFSRNVRPILARHCFKCHGPDDKARKGKLRLDLREAAIKGGKSGKSAVVPGKPDESEMLRRILSSEESEGMPPPSAKNPVSDSDKQMLRRWIAAGAEYKQHWAFVAPKQAPLPKVRQTDWPRNAVDYFVLAKMEAAGLTPSPRADRAVLVRRVYLDLIGLPPTPAEADSFIQDNSPDAYEKLVDRLLTSEHYGERWARRWLDLARYADTNGYEKDRVRSIWPYRDWVIRALNGDMPFDRFTIEQIAGDMLPNATPQQRIATGFHRNTMLNEEGGIDPLEFRFHAMTDRVATTGTTWLGLTVMCAQCHTHKYDPIPQREYYQLMACMNNADEPMMDVPDPETARRRAAIQKQIQAINDDLPNRFPPESDFRWTVARLSSAVSAGGATASILDDNSVRFSGKNPDKDTYTLLFDSDATDATALRLEVLTDPALPSTGPGRTPHGNFVLNEITATVATRDKPESGQPLKFVRAEADFAQNGFPAAHAIDGDVKTGWAIHGPGKWNVPRTAVFTLEKPITIQGGAHWTIKLDQQHGTQHTIGRLRLGVGQRVEDKRPLEVRRRENLERQFHAWLERESKRAVRWTVLRPVEAKANMPLLKVLDDDSVLASSDQTKRDVYDLKYKTDLRNITAVRLEVLPHESLPRNGPGRVFYEGPFGDFFLSEFTMSADGRPVKFSRATSDYSSGDNKIANAIDGSPQSGWSINGRQGKAHTAVLNLVAPLANAKDLALQMIFEQYYAAGLGRFRIAVTTDNRPIEAGSLPAEIEQLLLIPAGERNVGQRDQLLRHYLSIAPELASEREAIRKLESQMPAFPTTLVMAERPASETRPTHLHERGEFLKTADLVEPGVLSLLPSLPKDAPRNRLTFARWLVAPENPLVGRVTMNRQWAAFFGRGIVRTTEDFGFQGEPPTHPELLDWLAVEFVKRGWSIKQMHRLIVTSATYQQSSQAAPEKLEKDPQNKLLARGPRLRLEAELVRDAALKMSGLLSPKLGGPSVFPPQPPGISSEGAYGALPWNVSPGADRYRRGLYTFSKRTAPFAMFGTFDAPSGEACVARREVSNTPLQALTLLNDSVFVEAAQALGRSTSAKTGTVGSRAVELFRRCLVRPPSEQELKMLTDFYHAQNRRFESKELDAAAVAGPGDGDVRERAAWTAVARVLLNLDETITKE
jgi:hypothetical protein